MPPDANLNLQNMIPKNEDKARGGELLSQAQLAAALSIHPITVCRWTVAGLIPCHRVGRVVRYDLAAVLEAIEKKKGGAK